MITTVTQRRRLRLALLCLTLAAGLLLGLTYGEAANSPPRSATEPTTHPSPARPTPAINVAAPIPAQSGGSYAIAQAVIAGGGGTSAGGALSLSGSVGQSALGATSGGAFSLSGGFWQGASPCSAPSITSQPTAQTVCGGAAASFSVNVSGANLTYQWRKGGVNLSNGGNLSGVHSTTLLIAPAGAGDAAAYDVIITATCGSPVTSNAATLTVNTYSLSSMSQSFPAAGGTGSINVMVAGSCTWMAVSNDAWITVNSGTSGNGDGTINYSVSANNGGIRSGTLTIANQTFTVLQGIQFNDVPLSHPFYTEIGKLSARGVTGCGGGNFCPEQVVTREQMAAFLMRARGEFSPPQPAQQRFDDVPPTHGFYAFIERMALLQITLGCSANPPLYCPGSAVRREQMAAFLIRALNEPGYLPPAPGQQRFQDVEASHPFYGYIDEMAVRGITLGCSANSPLYCPSASVTRAQMAAFLVRAFDL